MRESLNENYLCCYNENAVGAAVSSLDCRLNKTQWFVFFHSVSVCVSLSLFSFSTCSKMVTLEEEKKRDEKNWNLINRSLFPSLACCACIAAWLCHILNKTCLWRIVLFQSNPSMSIDNEWQTNRTVWDGTECASFALSLFLTLLARSLFFSRFSLSLYAACVYVRVELLITSTSISIYACKQTIVDTSRRGRWRRRRRRRSNIHAHTLIHLCRPLSVNVFPGEGKEVKRKNSYSRAWSTLFRLEMLFSIITSWF